MAKALRIVADAAAATFWSVGMAMAAAVLATALGAGESWVITAMLLTGAVVFANVLFNKD